VLHTDYFVFFHFISVERRDQRMRAD
jgi:hypothetical protein